MRNHGWQLPYHPLQVVAVAVFMALGVAFYVFFVPFVGKRILQYVVMGVYSILVICVFGLYIWCAAADPADPGVFKSRNYLNLPENEKHIRPKNSKLVGESTSSIVNANASTFGEKYVDKDAMDTDVPSTSHAIEIEKKNASSARFMGLLAFYPFAFICNFCSPSEESSEQHNSEDGMFYCSLCEVEVFKYSKHCRVCDKCVDRFDHHCRWLNNCVGKRNYQKFFTLMISSLFLLIVQWSTGILVLTCCFLERKKFSLDVASKLGSSFTLLPYIIVVGVCTILSMIATLPLAQLFFFHILLIMKGISTYDYIMALREQEQEQRGVGGQESPQISPASSFTALSSTSSFTIHRVSWCTPPRLFLEDQFDVVPLDTRSVKKDRTKKKNAKAVKISPLALARLNAEDISKAATEARKGSKIMQPVVSTNAPFALEEANTNFGSSGRRRMIPRLESSRRRASKRIRLPDVSTSLATRTRIIASSPESSLNSPDIHPFRVSSPVPQDAMQLTSDYREVLLSRSMSDGYEASGGEDSDWIPSRIVQKSMNWSNPIFTCDHGEGVHRLKAPSSSGNDNIESFD